MDALAVRGVDVAFDSRVYRPIISDANGRFDGPSFPKSRQNQGVINAAVGSCSYNSGAPSTEDGYRKRVAPLMMNALGTSDPILTISIPAYNDGATIEDVVQEAVDAARQITDRFEILIINDGSSDDTAERVAALQGRVPELRYHEHPKNLGFGPTIREAYTLPMSEWVYFVPGDNQCPAGEVVHLYQSSNNADFVLGRRVDRQDPWRRRAVSWFYNWLVSLVGGCRVHDTNATGLLRRKVLGDDRLRSLTAFIHAEILLEVRRHGGRVIEVPAAHRPREHGTASGNKWRVILGTFRELVLYALDRKIGIPLWRNR